MSFKELNEALDSLDTSQCTFVYSIRKGYDNNDVIHGQLHKKVVNVENENNYYSELVVDRFNERMDFTTGQMVLNREDIIANIELLVKSDITNFLAARYECKELVATKLGKWYLKYALRQGFPEYKETMFSIAKYIGQNGLNNTNITNDNAHIKNALAILELFYEKNNKREHVGEKVRGRRGK